MSRFINDMWRKFKRLLGEEHWEFLLLVGGDEFLGLLRERTPNVARWLALSPGWSPRKAQFYGHVGARDIVLRVYPTSTDPRQLVSLVNMYAFVGRIVEGPNGLTLVGDYRVIPVFRQFGMLCFGILLLSVAIALVFLGYSLLIERDAALALRGLILTIISICFVAFLRFLVWLPERWDRPFRENLRHYLATQAAGRK